MFAMKEAFDEGRGEVDVEEWRRVDACQHDESFASPPTSGANRNLMAMRQTRRFL